jgi:CubicO group peptidase (beta-lactamase class C family)
MAKNDSFNIQGFVEPGWETVRSVFEQNLRDELDIGASVSVYHQGKCVIDLCGGWKDPQRTEEPYTPETLQLVFSVSKGVMAAAITLCIDRGWLDFEAPVVQYWPEFGVNGKEVIDS